MKSKAFDIKKKYEEFVSNTKAYHERMGAIIDPEEMCFQYARRSNILGGLSDLCNRFSNNSSYILEAFDKYKESMRKHGVNIDFSFFTEFVNDFINLLSNMEEISLWFDELYSEEKFLEEKKADEMSPSDINSLEN